MVIILYVSICVALIKRASNLIPLLHWAKPTSLLGFVPIHPPTIVSLSVHELFPNLQRWRDFLLEKRVEHTGNRSSTGWISKSVSRARIKNRSASQFSPKTDRVVVILFATIINWIWIINSIRCSGGFLNIHPFIQPSIPRYDLSTTILWFALVELLIGQRWFGEWWWNDTIWIGCTAGAQRGSFELNWIQEADY